MTCVISYNKDKYGENVTKSVSDVIEVQEVKKNGILRLVVDIDGHRIHKEYKLNDTMKISITFDD